MSYDQPCAECGLRSTWDLEVRKESGLQLAQQASQSKETSGSIWGRSRGRIRPLEIPRYFGPVPPRQCPQKSRSLQLPMTQRGEHLAGKISRQTWTNPAAEPPETVLHRVLEPDRVRGPPAASANWGGPRSSGQLGDNNGRSEATVEQLGGHCSFMDKHSSSSSTSLSDSLEDPKVVISAV